MSLNFKAVPCLRTGGCWKDFILNAIISLLSSVRSLFGNRFCYVTSVVIGFLCEVGKGTDLGSDLLSIYL